MGGEGECELGLPAGEVAEDGEWILAIFELGSIRRATSAAARTVSSPEGAHLVFEPRDWTRVLAFAQTEARRSPSVPPSTPPSPSGPRTDRAPDTTRSAGN